MDRKSTRRTKSALPFSDDDTTVERNAARKPARLSRLQKGLKREEAALRENSDELFSVLEYYFTDTPKLHNFIRDNKDLIIPSEIVADLPDRENRPGVTFNESIISRALNGALDAYRSKTDDLLVSPIVSTRTDSKTLSKNNILKSSVRYVAKTAFSFRQYPLVLDKLETLIEDFSSKWQYETKFHLFAISALEKDHTNLEQLSTIERLDRLKEYAIRHGNEGLDKLARTLFPEWSVESQEKTLPSLPSVAPALWKDDKLSGETPPAFVQRVYGKWLGKGLTRAHVRHLDPSLYQAIASWSRKPGNEWPSEVDLPTAKERSAREIEALRAQSTTGSLYEVLGNFTAKEAERIRSNLRRHEHRKK